MFLNECGISASVCNYCAFDKLEKSKMADRIELAVIATNKQKKTGIFYFLSNY